MNETANLSFEVVMEVLAEKLATQLSREPSRLYPRLMTIDQAAVYLGSTREVMRRLVGPGNVPTVQIDGRVFLDRLDLDRWIERHKVSGS